MHVNTSHAKGLLIYSVIVLLVFILSAFKVKKKTTVKKKKTYVSTGQHIDGLMS